MNSNTEVLAFIIYSLERLKKMSIKEIKKLLADVKDKHPDQEEIFNILRTVIKERKNQGLTTIL